MKRLIFVFSFLALVLTVSSMTGVVRATSAEAAVQTIEVSNAREFLEALGSNRIIEMDYSGDYNLSKWEFSDDLTLPAGVRWEGVFDGAELVLSGINNLTINGGGPDGANSRIIVDPRYAFVMKFENCSDIVINGPWAGHSVGGSCEGGVFGFTDSSRITISYTEMYGCGTEGLTLSNVSDMKVAHSVISNCTYYIMTVTGGANISFENCMFAHNQEYTLVNVSGTRNMSFTDCDFYSNRGEMFNVNSTTVTVSNSLFNRNVTGYPIQDSLNVEFKNCEFK